jgi:excisionase family DNA binding protein
MSIGDAASQLNVSIDTIRRRVRSGAIKAQRDSRGQWWVEVPNPKPEPQPPTVEERTIVGVGTPLSAGPADDDVIALLRDLVADLRARLDASESQRREEAARASAERDRLLSMIDGIIAKK